MANRIVDIRDPTLFQRLVHALFAEERGRDFQIVDDSSGDRGNDGYDSQAGWLLAIYCPEKGLQDKGALKKARADLAKATRLKNDPGYRVAEWVFITPEALSERVQATLRAEAADVGLRATFLSAVNLESIYLKFPHLHDLFPELMYAKVQVQLESINTKLDRVLVGGVPVDAMASSRPAGTAEQTAYSVDLFPGFRSDAVAALQARLHAGDLSARHELEQYRLEATDARDRLVALMVEVEHDAEHLDFDAVERRAAEGLGLAERTGARAEAGVFRARLAFAKNMKLVLRETEFLSRLGMSANVGFPFVSDEETTWFDREAPSQRRELNDLFKAAYRDARDSRNLMALMSVVLLYANAATQSTFPLRVPGRELITPDIPQRITHSKGIVEGAYDLAISVAQALGSKRLLAMAYSNFANDLSVFGDRDRALSHAERALGLAREVGDKHQQGRTERLIDLLRPGKNRGKV
jgi:hypothetical protein